MSCERALEERRIQKYRSFIFLYILEDGSWGGHAILDKIRLWNKKALRLLVQEYQRTVDYKMVIRCMDIEVKIYQKQLRQIKRTHDENRNLSKSSELLSGFKADERLIPVITVVINLSKEAWNGAKSLHELVYPNDDLVRRYVSNYTMNIVDYHDYDSFEKLSTGVRKIFEVLKCSGDSKAMERLVALDSSYESMDDETADFVEEIADLKIKKDEGGRRNMCKEIQMFGFQGTY